MLLFNYPTPVPLGDTCSIPFALTNVDGTPYDYTGHILKLFISETQTDTGTYALTKATTDGGISPVSTSGGTGNINFLAADALALTGKTYNFALRDETAEVTLSSGAITFADHPGR